MQRISHPTRWIQSLTLAAAVVWLSAAVPAAVSQELPPDAVQIEPEVPPPGSLTTWPEEIDRLHGLLVAEATTADERVVAARLLLDRGDEVAVESLVEALDVHRGEVDAAVAQAVAESFAAPSAELIQPLWQRLREADSGRDLLARALGRFDASQTRELLLRHAGDQTQPLKVRLGAIQALGHLRRQAIARQLIALLDEQEPPKVADAAMSALQTLTGLQQLGMDRAAWRQWWQSVEPLDEAGWKQHLLHNLAVADSRNRDLIKRMRQRLVDAQRSLYRFADPENRSAALVEMLRDPLTEIRSLGIDLALQRLLDNQPFSNGLLNALRERMIDPDPLIRERTALLMRDLRDTTAADIAALRLVNQSERHEPCIRALFRLLERVPRQSAIEPALTHLQNPAIRADAAGALTTFAQQGWLSDEQTETALQTVRAQVNGQAPPPQVISLLAVIGREADWQRIAGWISHSDVAIKQAAARAWADSDRDLMRLARLLDDPVIQPIFLSAAAKRGQQPDTFAALADFVPLDTPAREAWQRAMLAMAPRVPPAALLKLARDLRQPGASQPLSQPHIPPDPQRQAARQALRRQTLPDLTDQMLSAALNQPAAPLPPRHQLDLLISRAAIRLDLARAADALSDVQAARALLGAASIATTLDSDQRQAKRSQLRLLNIRGLLQLGEVTPAAQIALSRAAATSEPDARNLVLPPDDPAVELFIDAARHFAGLERTEKVEQIITQLYLLLGPEADEDLLRRIKRLEAETAGATTPALEQSDPPATNGD